jgi:hypothetical protein
MRRLQEQRGCGAYRSRGDEALTGIEEMRRPQEERGCGADRENTDYSDGTDKMCRPAA